MGRRIGRKDHASSGQASLVRMPAGAKPSGTFLLRRRPPRHHSRQRRRGLQEHQMETARDQLTTAGGVCPEDPAHPLGAIGHAVLATLLRARRPRYSTCKVKPPPPATSTATTTAHRRPPPSPPSTSPCNTPPLDTRQRRGRSHSALSRPASPTHRQRSTAIMSSDRHRDRSGAEPARQLQIKPRTC